MSRRVVLDSSAFDVVDTPAGRRLRALIGVSAEQDADTYCAAVTLAEVCHGRAHTRRVEAALARPRGGRRIRVVPTDEGLAKLVGAILHGTGADSEMIADAHVVATCAGADTAVVVTADPADITRLGAALPGVRIVTRAP